jgi:hypothetical protein
MYALGQEDLNQGLGEIAFVGIELAKQGFDQRGRG